MGSFGENFTINGLQQLVLRAPGGRQIHLAISSPSAPRSGVTQPRLPCYKLGVRFGSDDMVSDSW